ncbi:MAG: hypothetical protein EBS07_12190, partial [Sphingobacteriia bacterium]|nr:hypothetical protein [Sphingobacteriia bacterium]
FVEPRKLPSSSVDTLPGFLFTHGLIIPHANYWQQKPQRNPMRTIKQTILTLGIIALIGCGGGGGGGEIKVNRTMTSF